MPATARAKPHEIAQYHYLADAMRGLERDLHGHIARSGLIPEEWHRVSEERGPGQKVRMALWIEADVLRFYRSQGAGHTRRMAEVLRSFMHARLSALLRGPEGLDYGLPPEGPGALRLKDLRARMKAEEERLQEARQKRREETFPERLAAIKVEYRDLLGRRRQKFVSVRRR